MLVRGRRSGRRHDATTRHLQHLRELPRGRSSRALAARRPPPRITGRRPPASWCRIERTTWGRARVCVRAAVARSKPARVRRADPPEPTQGPDPADLSAVAKDLVERIRRLLRSRAPSPTSPTGRTSRPESTSWKASRPRTSGHLAHDRDHWASILARGMDADRHVRGADGPGSDDHRRSARQLAVRLGHERRAALVAGTDHADAFVDERLEERQEALTGDREGKPHAGGAQLAGHERRHGHRWRVHLELARPRAALPRRRLRSSGPSGALRCPRSARPADVGVGRLGHSVSALRRRLWRLGQVRSAAAGWASASGRLGARPCRQAAGLASASGDIAAASSASRPRHGAVVPDGLRRLGVGRQRFGGGRQRLVARERPVGVHRVDSRLLGVVRQRRIPSRRRTRRLRLLRRFGRHRVGRRGVVGRGDVGGSCRGVGRRRVVGR